MSRPSALRETLKLPSSHSLEIISVEATGDCFYDCIHELLTRHYECKGSTSSSSSSEMLALLPPILHSFNSSSEDTEKEGVCNVNDPAITVPSSQYMRNFVADQLTTEQFDLYKMYAMAGLDEYNFSTNLKTLQDLQTFAKKCGKTNGPGKCFWADEFALRTISDGLHLTLLIIDDQAKRSRGSGSGGRKRGRGREEEQESSDDNRFVFIGNYARAAILHRSRRQHYNAVVIDGCAVIELEHHLPVNVKSLWPIGKIDQESAAKKPKSCSKEDDEMVDINEGKSNETKDVGEEIGKQETPSSKQQESTFEGKHSAPSAVAEAKPSSTSLGNFYCGCAGFSSSSWVGNFYPKSIVGNNSDRQLNHYQQHFRTVEINSTFYGIPTSSTVQRWSTIFSKSYKVEMKAPKGLTHEKSYLDCSVLSAFMSRMQPLHDSLACILIQCPKTLVVTVLQLEQIKTVLCEEAKWYNGRIAIEFRNEATYFDKELRSFLNQSGYALVMHPNSVGRSTVGSSTHGRVSGIAADYQPDELSNIVTEGMGSTSFVYLRLHGFNDEHRGEYTIEQLKEISEQVHSWRTTGLEVFCFILNDLEPSEIKSQSPRRASQIWDKWCAMPKNAKQLEHCVYESSNESIPNAPKKPKSTMLSFFGKRTQPSTSL